MRVEMTDSATARDVAHAIAPPAYGRWLGSGLMLLFAAWFAWVVATNPNFEWAVVAQYPDGECHIARAVGHA